MLVLSVALAAMALAASAAFAAEPTLTVDPVGAPSIVTAQVSGTVSFDSEANGGSEGYWYFQYCQDLSPGECSAASSWTNGPEAFANTLPAGTTAAPVDEVLTGLKAATEYTVRLAAFPFATGAAVFSEEAGYRSFTTDSATAPSLTIGGPTAVTPTSAHLSGTVNPNGGNVDTSAGTLPIDWELQYAPAAEPEPRNWQSAGSSGEDPIAGANAEAGTAIAVAADATGLAPNTAYKARVIAKYVGLMEASGQEGFTTPAIKPEVTLATATEGTATSIVLNGIVNPHNSPLSDCHFAYSIGTSLDHSAPCEGTLPSGEGARGVHAQLIGLNPGTEYSYALLAGNSVGSDESDPGHFGTPTGAASAACPNEAIRIAQHATNLGDCRAWEMVSPSQKGDGDIIAEGEAVVASASGDGASFDSRLGFADTVGSATVGRTTYLARRGTAGWSVHSITPTSRPEVPQILYGPTQTGIFSSDLAHVLTWGYDLPGASDDTPARANLYVEDTATRSLRTISATQTGSGDPIQYNPQEFSDPQLFGASDDLQHVAFVTSTQFLPADPTIGYPQQGSENVYTWDDGTIHLAGILPDGMVPPQGSRVGFFGQKFRGTMSADGSRQEFLASPTSGALAQLYLRIDHSRTAWVSEPENPEFSGEPEGVAYEGMTPDGKNVFFVTNSPLLKADTAEGPDLYRWTSGPDPAHESNLTLITNTGSAVKDPNGFGGALVGMSDDGGRVYVTELNGELKLWDHGVTTTVDPSVPRQGDERASIALSARQPGFGRVSPDGNWLTYINTDGSLDVEFGKMYLYDRRAGTDTCISCPAVASLLPKITNGGRYDFVGFRPRFLTDGGRVFFTSTGALVPEDTNGVADVYSYDGPSGKLSLISSGRGSEPSEFADGSQSGNDVFFLTRQRLVPSDRDEYADLYDARVGGGFDEPQSSASPPCSGEACQGAGAAAPGAAPVGSTAGGRGNLKPKARKKHCAKGTRKVRDHGKVRCTKKHKRPAGAKRGGRS